MNKKWLKSEKVLLMIGILLIVLGILSLWNLSFLKNVYISDQTTWLGLILNGFIFVLFFLGLIQLVRAFIRYAFEEKQVDIFMKSMEEKKEFFLQELSPDSIISNRYLKIKHLYDKRAPINHGAISSIMLAEESLYQSFPKFVNNILILTGVFGTIVSLILALMGANVVLKTSVSGEGMGFILNGMNTALTTTATAIVCFFFFTFFYQKLTDIQTHLFGKIEEAVLTYIVPEFTFDAEAIHLKTDLLVKELRGLIEELKGGTNYIQNILSGVNDHNIQYLDKMDTFITRQDDQLIKTEDVLLKLENVNTVLKEGFRLKE